MIIYNKLANYLKANNMKWIDLQNGLGLSPSVMAKLQKNRNVNTETLDKVCEFLKIQPSEIMEWIPNAEYEKQNAEKLAIEKQIAELQAKLKNM